MDKFTAKVTSANSTYTARAEGKNASCTAGETQAIKALAVKIFGKDVPIKIKLINSISMSKSIFEVTKDTGDQHANV